MFMLKNPIEDYESAPLRTSSLASNEQQHFSFVITETEKQLLGYKPRPEAQYLCHFTNNRLIFEPQAYTNNIHSTSKIASQLLVSKDSLFYQLAYDEIASFKVIRSVNLAPCVKITLKPTCNAPNHELILVATSLPQAKIENSSANCSVDFVTLGNLMLQVDEVLIQQIQNSPVPVLTYFWAPGCKPCEMFAPVLDEFVEQFQNQIHLIKINLNDNVSVSMRYGVDGAPTVLLFKDGAIVERVNGAIPAALFAKVLRRHL